jgi:hypothetical protein
VKGCVSGSGERRRMVREMGTEEANFEIFEVFG